ncbi:hypothetical protein [Nonomuraea sp. NPDC049141]|uniref:zinc finger domain-containing protein n=1 Tax=Nonomuraea sp. NPDC049141 TaxID=3155500 RepID=UPI0033DDF325
MSESMTATNLPDLASNLMMAAVGLRELVLQAEVVTSPLELGPVCYKVEESAQLLETFADQISKADRVIREGQPVARTLHDGMPWGDAAEPGAVLTLHQLLALAGSRHRSEDSIPYLDGVRSAAQAEPYVSSRVWRSSSTREQRERLVAAYRQACSTCRAVPGRPCVTKSGRVMTEVHQPRLRAAE